VPQITATWRVEGPDGQQVAVVKLEQAGEPFDLPLTVTLDYADKPSVDVLVRMTERSTEQRIPLSGRLQKVQFNRDRAALGNFK